jgi:DNA invertase Pin-like site-specific DNA recombinase
MTIYGYARVSTQGQDLSAQIEALKVAGAATIYREKVGGVRANRPELAKLMAKLTPGDMVIVTKLDRLGVRLVSCST